ncbi:MAG: 16S rRNA (cytosine(1402)-N(4))-methyltransferase RsmH [Gammaproteobacteria bacterium]|nr:MAG: 16S rRNA (cytosine(1402)-N(4))-methyltransferase RsmH [Gammaproteobacteria bacterium]
MTEHDAHAPVLLDEALEALVTDDNGHYIDGTFGRGGHSRALLERLSPSARLLVIDKDPRAVAEAKRLALREPRLLIRRGSFAGMRQYCSELGWVGDVRGVLLDLGVSSPQLDDATRGFSFLRSGPLDMRMDPEQGESAAQWLGRADEQEIADVLFRYGEERHARRIARAIVRRRSERPILETGDLAEIVASAVPRREPGKHPATRSFQAIRIHVNRELEDLERGLRAAVEVLASGGRLVVISFHSLEDRIVKRFLREQARGPQAPRRGLPPPQDQPGPRLRLVGKAVRPGEDEVRRNPRARSAVMRVAERLA